MLQRLVKGGAVSTGVVSMAVVVVIFASENQLEPVVVELAAVVVIESVIAIVSVSVIVSVIAVAAAELVVVPFDLWLELPLWQRNVAGPD